MSLSAPAFTSIRPRWRVPSTTVSVPEPDFSIAPDPQSGAANMTSCSRVSTVSGTVFEGITKSSSLVKGAEAASVPDLRDTR